MPDPSFDGKVYVCAYLGKGALGISYRDKLQKRAKQRGMSLSNYLLAAGLGTLVADTLHKVADTRAKPFPAMPDLPPSLRLKAPPKPSRPMDQDGIPMIESPAITEQGPSSKPVTADI